MKTRFLILPLILLALVLPVALSLAVAPEAKFIDRDTLKSMLGDPDLLIIDARHGAELARSNRQIKGALRFSPEGVASWGPKLPKNRKVVVYCDRGIFLG